MMAESRWTKTSLFLMMLQFTAAVTGQLSSSQVVREGHEATLPCKNLIEGQQNCDGTTWLSVTGTRATETLVRDGRVEAKDKVRVTQDCSLLIKKVTEKDFGYYECRQQQGPDARVYLSVVNVFERNGTEDVTIHCSVLFFECKPEVKWLLRGREIDKDNDEMKISQSDSMSSVTFLRSNFIYPERHQLLKCEVSDGDAVQLFPISPLRLSGEGTTTTTTNSTETDVWWAYVIVAVVLLAVLITTVAAVRWKRRRGSAQGERSRSAPAACAPETSQDMADPEDVCYTSVIHTSETNSKTKVQRKNDDESAVTYSTVKASSADPTNLYATVK